MTSKDVDQPYLKCTFKILCHLPCYCLVYIDRVESSKASFNKIVSTGQRRFSPTKRIKDKAEMPLNKPSTQPDEVKYIFSHFYYDHNISFPIKRTRTMQ